MPAARGERQMFPRQTNKIFTAQNIPYNCYRQLEVKSWRYNP